MHPKEQTKQSHDGGSTDADKSVEGQAGAVETGPARLEEGGGAASAVPSPSGAAPGASEDDRDPFAPQTGSDREAADRALLEAEDARLQRLREALHREWRRRLSFGVSSGPHAPVGADVYVREMYPWVWGAFNSGNYRSPFRNEEQGELAGQVEDEFADLKRKELERKQGKDKAD